MIPKEKRKKLDAKSEEGVVLRCLENSMHKVWLRDRQMAMFSRDVRVDEGSFPAREWNGNDGIVITEEDQNKSAPIRNLFEGLRRPELSRQGNQPGAPEQSKDEEQEGPPIEIRTEDLTYIPETPSIEGIDTVNAEENNAQQVNEDPEEESETNHR